MHLRLYDQMQRETVREGFEPSARHSEISHAPRNPIISPVGRLNMANQCAASSSWLSPVAEIDLQDSVYFCDRLGIALCHMARVNDQFRLRASMVRAPIRNNPVGTVRRIVPAPIPHD